MPNKTVRGVCVVVLIILVIAQTIVGVQYKDDCPLQPFIPIYLYGFVGVIALICFGYMCNICNMCNAHGCCVTAVFFFFWFIAGSIVIYSNYEPNYENSTQAGLYCNKTLYLFAFWSTTLTYVLLAGAQKSFKPFNQPHMN